MSDDFTRMKLGPTRRQFLQTTAMMGGAALLASLGRLGEAFAQGASDTLVIAAPATPQGLDIEFDVSLGSINSLGALYEYMLAYEKDRPIRTRRACCARIPPSIPDKPNNLALRGRLAEILGSLSATACKATFKLREGVKSNWGNTFTSKDVKWTWDRKFNLKGQGLFQTAVLGLQLAGPDQGRGRLCDLLQSRKAQSAAAEAAVQPRQPDL